MKTAIGNLRHRMQNIYKIKYRKIKMRDETLYSNGKGIPKWKSHTWHLVEGYTGILNASRIKAKLMVNTGREL